MGIRWTDSGQSVIRGRGWVNVLFLVLHHTLSPFSSPVHSIGEVAEGRLAGT